MLKEAFLELRQRLDGVVGIALPLWGEHQFVVIVISAVNDRNTLASKLRDWLKNAQNIAIQLLAVAADRARYEAIIDRINKAMLGMFAAERAIDLRVDGLAEVIFTIHLTPFYRDGIFVNRMQIFIGKMLVAVALDNITWLDALPTEILAKSRHARDGDVENQKNG